MRRRGGDELVALLARLPALRGELGEMLGRGGVGLFAGAVETLPQRFGHARVLRVERLPFVAQLLDVLRDLRGVEGLGRDGLGALAQLDPGILLAERFPALEIGQLLHHAAEPLRGRLGQWTRAGLVCADLVGRRPCGLQLAGGERLLGGVQQVVHALPRGARFVLRSPDLLQPALFDDHQRGLETPRQRRRAYRAIQRLPALRQIRVVDRRCGGELLGFDDQGFGVGLRPPLAVPFRDALLRHDQIGQRGRVGVLLRLRAPIGERDGESGRFLGRRGRRERLVPFAQATIESRAGPLLFLLAIEARLDRATRGVAAGNTVGIVTDFNRLPAAVELDQRRDDRAGPDRERFELRDDRVGLGGLIRAMVERIGPLPGETGDPVILVARRVGEPAQVVGPVHAFGRRHPRLGMPGDERDLDQRVFAANRGNRRPAPVCVRRPASDLHANRIGALVGVEHRACGGRVRRLRQRIDQRRRDGGLHRGVGFRMHGGSERREIAAAPRGGGADIRRRIAGDELRELVRVGRQFLDAEQSLRGLDVFVQRGAIEELGDHGGVGLRGARAKDNALAAAECAD